jgi:aspartate carbamoyltransferase catalytic subunit
MSHSWISLKSFSELNFQELIRLADEFKKLNHNSSLKTQKSYALVFFEPSTRTRMSFERAIHLIGGESFSLVGPASTSIEKGESLEDTVFNIAAMKPDALIVRCGDNLDLFKLSQKISIPIVCAGWGKVAHPTQALLDAYTLWQEWGTLQGKKILFMGDAQHSRVLSSHLELLPNLGAKIAFWCPDALRVSGLKVDQDFDSKDHAVSWADAIIGLRLQKERLQTSFNWDSALDKFQLTRQDLDKLKTPKPLLHPGPVGWGQEFNQDLKGYSHSLILSQVTNGVYLRAALLRQIGGLN